MTRTDSAFPHGFDLQIFSEEDDTAKAERVRQEQAERERIKAEEDRDREDLSKKTNAELLEITKTYRTQAANYRTRLKTANDKLGERDTEINGLKTQLSEATGKIEAADRAKLEEEGKIREVAQKDRERAEKAEQKAAETEKELKRLAVHSKVVAAAQRAGLDNDKILDLFKSDMDKIKVASDGTVSDDAVNAIVESAKATFPRNFVKRDENGKTTEELEAEEKERQRQQNLSAEQKRQEDADRRRRAAGGTTDKVDWRSLTPEQFAEKERELNLVGGGRV